MWGKLYGFINYNVHYLVFIVAYITLKWQFDSRVMSLAGIIHTLEPQGGRKNKIIIMIRVILKVGMSCHVHLLPPTNFETYLFFNEAVQWHAVFHFVGVHYPSHGVLNGFADFCALPEGRWRSTYNEAVRQILTYIVVFLTHSPVQKSAQCFGQILMPK
jgi:hypothetical protein